MSASNVATAETVRKYMAQLQKEAKVGHALRRLSRLTLTLPVMTETGVGKAVNVFIAHPEHNQLALDLIDKIITVAAAARGTAMDTPTPSRKRPADDSMADGITAASGLTFAEALKACAAPPPAKKPKVVKPVPLPAAAIPPPMTISAPTSPATEAVTSDSDDLFEITRKHTQSKVYSGKKKAIDAANSTAPALPTIPALMQRPSMCAFNDVATVLARCTAAQLERVEQLNPAWRKQTDLMWQKICIQQFPKASCAPADNNSWRSVFNRCTKEADQKLANLTAKINKGFADQQKTTTAVIPLLKSKKPVQRRPLAPLNAATAPSPKPRTAAAAKPKPAPMMARALKMMKNRHRR